MPRTGRIDDIINVSAVQKQVEQTNTALRSVIAQMAEIAKSADKIKLDFASLKTTEKLAKGFRELAAANDSAAIASEKVNKLMHENAILEEKLRKARTDTAIAAQKLADSQNKKVKVQKEENAILAEQAKLEKKKADLQNDEIKRNFKLREEIQKLTAQRKAEVRSIDQVTDSVDALEKEVKLLTAQYDELSKEEKQSASSKELQNKIASLNNELREEKVLLGNMKANVGNYRESMEGLGTTVQHNTTIFQRFRNTVTSSMAEGFAGTRALYATIAGWAAAAAGTFYTIKRWVTWNAELSDSMAAVRRTTGMTEAEVMALNETLRNLNTRTAQASLLDLAHVAGKLGIAKNEIAGFVKAADMIGVALGKDLGDNEEAINQLGRIVSLFKVNEGSTMESALLKIGSALKDLGNASVAEEINIIDFTKRLGGIATVAGVSVDKIMALGATFDLMGQTMEVSSTAVNAIWVGMAQKTDRFAKIAGMSVEEFTKLMARDFNEAFIAVAEGLRKNEGGFFELAENFKSLGLDGRRIIQTMGALSMGVEQYRIQLDIARESMGKGTTAAQQFAIQNENLAAKIAKAWREFQNFAANSGTLKFLSDGVDELTKRLVLFSIAIKIAKGDLGGGGLDITTDPEKIKAKKVRASQTKDDQYRKILITEIALSKKALEIELQRKKNQEDINALNASNKGVPTLGPTKEQLRIEKAMEDAYKRLDKQMDVSENRQEALLKKGDSLLEKSYRLRVELGMVSLEEQEKHDKEALQARIDDLNDAATQELINEAQIKAKREKWTNEQLASEISKIKANSQEQIITKQQTAEMMLTIEIDYIKKRNDIDQQAANLQEETFKSLIKGIQDESIKAELSDKLKVTKKRAEALTELRRQLEEREITIKEYRIREQEINDEADIDVLNSTIAILEKTTEALRNAGAETMDIETRIAELKIQLNEKVTNSLSNSAKKRINLTKEEWLQVWQAVSGVAGDLNNLVGAMYDSQIAKIDERVAANRAAWDEELQAANGNRKKEKEINARRRKEEQEQEKERKKALRDQAILQKAIGAAQIVINTAIGAVAQFQAGPAGIALAALVIAAGAAALATLLVTPIPSYEKGRKGGKAEVARVSEKGSELVVTKDGQVFLTPPKESLAYIPAGADIIPNDKLVRAAVRSSLWDSTSSGQLSMRYEMDATNARIDETNTILRGVIHTIANKKETHLNVDDRGFWVSVRKQAMREDYINRKIRL